MKSKTLMLLAVAVGCGVVASYLTSRVTAERTVQAGAEKVSVLVAKRNISTGTLLSEPEKWFEEKPFVKGEEPRKAIRSFDNLKNRRLNKPLNADRFVTAEDLSEPPNTDDTQVLEEAKGLITRLEDANNAFASVEAVVGRMEPGFHEHVVKCRRLRDELKTAYRNRDANEVRRVRKKYESLAVQSGQWETKLQRVQEQLEKQLKQKAFYENLLKHTEKVVSDLKDKTRQLKALANEHRLFLRRFQGVDLTSSAYSALLQRQKDQERMDNDVRSSEAWEQRLEMLTQQLRQAVSGGDWESAATVHQHIKECAARYYDDLNR